MYDILEVERNATNKEIKQAFRKLAMQYHPDQAEGDKNEAEAKFKEINEAYSILSDSRKRLNYDRFGFNTPFTGYNSNVTYTSFGGESKKTLILEKLNQNVSFDIRQFADRLRVSYMNLRKIIEVMIRKGMAKGKIIGDNYNP